MTVTEPSPTTLGENRRMSDMSVAQSERAAPSQVANLGRLLRSELRLFTREAQVLVFVFILPVITVIVLGGVFGTDTDDSGFEFINPSHFYVSAYYGVMLSSIGVIMLPTHIASYREEGVVRRFLTAGFAPWVFPASQVLCGLLFAMAGTVVLAGTALLADGIPPMERPGETIAAMLLGAVAFISLGVALGMVLPSGRVASGIGLALFFPMFLLSGSGPPPAALSDTMRQAGELMPLSHVIRAAQEPWHDIGTGDPHLAIVFGIIVASVAVWFTASRKVAGAA